MKLRSSFSHFNSIPKQVGVMASCWLAINSLGYDRTPELEPGSVEMLV